MRPLLLLHGAIGSAAQFNRFKSYLSGSYAVHTLNFYGHGGDVSSEKFSIEGFAEQAASFVHSLNLHEPINIVGYSMGGYVAMYMAKHLSTPIEKIITLGTKFNWDEAIAAKECNMLQPDVIEQKVPVFAKQLSERHGQDWKNILNRTADMLQQMGRTNPLRLDDYTSIQTLSLIMLGDRDKMVTKEESIAVYQSLPNAQLAILPATPHPIEQVDAAFISYHIKHFLQ
jgi:esterase